jgi:serine/threonine-protein kinase
MSEFVFNCSFCGQAISTDDSLCGQADICPVCKNSISIPIPGLMQGAQFGDFELLEILGAGATGEVWKARQLSMDRIVALKILLPNLTTNKNFIERFQKEARHSAKLTHPMIVTAYYYGQDKGIHYLAITYVEGKTIADVLKEGKVYSEREALEIIKGIATALAYAWKEFNIIHRDIKPENIMIDLKGNPMLLDLGIAKNTSEDTGLTMTGMVIGTPYYMSPEQAVGDKTIDFRSDIYSLGATLYHLLTGNVPYQADSAMAIMMKHLNDTYHAPTSINSNISKSTEQIIKKMMEKDQNLRYQDWNDLIEDIDRVLRKKKLIHAKPEQNPFFKNILILSIFTIIALAISAGIFYAVSTKNTFSLKTIEPKKQISKPEKKDKVIQKNKSSVIKNNIKTNKKNQNIKLKEDINSKKTKKNIESKIEKKTTSKPKKTEKKTPKKKSLEIASKKIAQKKINTKKINTKKENTKKEAIKTFPKTSDNNTTVDTDDFQIGKDPKFFKEVASNLDTTKHSYNEVESYWDSINGKEFNWQGKIDNYRSLGLNDGYEVRVAAPGAKLFNGFNIILHIKDKTKTEDLGNNRKIMFKGTIFRKQPIKNTGAVIIHMKDVHIKLIF